MAHPDDVYRNLVEVLRRGARVPELRLREILAEAGRSYEALVKDMHVASPAAPQPGDPCPRCPGRLRIYSTKRRGLAAAQYLECATCGAKPTPHKRVVPAAVIRPRRKAV
jgi:hypothetical protein